MLTVQEVLAVPGMADAVHNVKLLEVQCDPNGYERLVVEIGGARHELSGGGEWNDRHAGHNLGKRGYLVPALPFSTPLPVGAFHFRAYLDQSLRRMPELDCHTLPAVEIERGRAYPFIGWCCDARPNGFRAPVGIVPGEQGGFVPDETIELRLRVPAEFVRECNRHQMTPQQMLQSFVGDLSGIINQACCPRADGYSSNGSDEREYADAWLQRAHGMNAINLDELEQAEGVAQDQREILLGLLEDFESYGGNPDDLIAAVTALVDDKSK